MFGLREVLSIAEEVRTNMFDESGGNLLDASRVIFKYGRDQSRWKSFSASWSSRGAPTGDAIYCLWSWRLEKRLGHPPGVGVDDTRVGVHWPLPHLWKGG
jgi:hypothetical protein